MEDFSSLIARSPGMKFTRIKPVHPINSTHRIIGALRVGFIVSPILAGFYRILSWLESWDQLVAPEIARLAGENEQSFMLVVGVVEIVSGIGVALLPRVFAYVVAAWLVGIIGNLLLYQFQK